MSELLILKNIQNHVSLNSAEKQYLKSKLKIKTFKRKELLLMQTQLCKNLFFVEDGSLRAFNINSEDKESTIMFAMQNWWITDMNCFINKKPAQLSIEAIEESKIISISLDVLNDLYIQIPIFERLFRILFQNAYIREQQRSLQYLSKNTHDRYNLFVKQYPGFVKKLTQKQIASYLGVTPEFLSSIKNK